MEASRPLVLLLLAWSLAPPAGGQSPGYQAFLRRHHDHPRSPAGRDYCATQLQRRGLARPCRPSHTFVHAPKAQIQAVCGAGGLAYWGHRRRSRAHFPVTTCALRGPPWGRCAYLAQAAQRFLVLSCDPAGWPVDLDESHIM